MNVLELNFLPLGGVMEWGLVVCLLTTYGIR